MTYAMTYHIMVGSYQVKTLQSVSIKKSVEQLSDTAVITLPGTLINQTLQVEDSIAVGDPVTIRLGYNNDLQTEFTGYVKNINTDNTAIQIECEDELYLWEVALRDEQLHDVSLKTLLQHVATQVNAAKGTNYHISCDYSFTYKTFTISHAKAWDVLKKIQDECKANVYFEGTTLHIHPQYAEVRNRAIYDFALNVLSSDLKYKKAEDKKIEVEINYFDMDGKKHTAKYGTTGGQKIERTISASDETSIQSAAQNEWNLWNYSGYEGGLTGWLIPFCQPMDMVEIRDSSYPHKTGNYYVVSTNVEFSANGGRRKVTLGKRM